MKKVKCNLYTRVSTSMQADGYNLDAQREKLKRYAEFQNMEIINEYSDEGKSGKSVEGRPEFQRMLNNIENGTDDIDFVLVFKLSGFGSNAVDMLNSLQRMQDYGVNLICVEDGIDSSKDSGKLMISVLSAVAEIEREMNQYGCKKKKRQNNMLDAYDASFIKGVLDNPIYCGKLAFGRRKNEKVPGTRNEYGIVKQENYMLNDSICEAIISEEDWLLAQKKRQQAGISHEKVHSLEHEHILSGILKCPLCDSGMYGNVNRKKRKDGTLYKDYFYYACKHRRLVDGHNCSYRKQWSEDKVNEAVAEVIKKLVQNPKFEETIREKIGSHIDTTELRTEMEGLEKQLRQLEGAKSRRRDFYIH